MVQGLTDKQSLSALMKDSREDRQTTARVKTLAAKGVHDPSLLTPDETRELCGSVLRQIERRERA